MSFPEVPPVVHIGSGKSPEDRVEDDRKDAKRARRAIAVSLIMMLAGLGAVTWITLTG